jgi:hypothetical protein
MTESDWITATDPQEMLLFLRYGGKASERKLRLFAAACCRRIWHSLYDERSRRAVEAAERYTDGDAAEGELKAAWEAARLAHDEAMAVAVGTAGAGGQPSAGEPVRVDGRVHALMAAQWASKRPACGPAWTTDLRFTTVTLVASALNAVAASLGPAAGGERATQAALLRGLLGLRPFRPVTLPPSVRTWNEGTIVKLAEAAYQERSLPSGELDRERLAVLADALEEVGADDLLLGHLRGPGPHVRGDWVIEMLTGRE